jgi:hypothetical protein
MFEGKIDRFSAAPVHGPSAPSRDLGSITWQNMAYRLNSREIEE